jgi:DNA-binding SARP family transcriptional activator
MTEFPDDPWPEWRLSLLGAWQLSHGGRPIPVGRNGQRLFAFLAVHGTCDRSFVAGALWPDSSDVHANGNLRATLHRLQQRGVLLTPGGGALSMYRSVQVDTHRVVAAAARVLDGPPGAPDRATLRDLVGEELLTGWYDDWVLLERERLRQLRLYALETLSDRFLRAGAATAAVEAALATVALEPLRESAHGAVIRAHLVEGNRAEALQQFGRLRHLLRAELGVEPSRKVAELFRR